jgi:hypothetical protein
MIESRIHFYSIWGEPREHEKFVASLVAVIIGMTVAPEHSKLSR